MTDGQLLAILANFWLFGFVLTLDRMHRRAICLALGIALYLAALR